MRIPITDTLTLVRADERNWSLVRARVSREGKPRDELLGYFGRLDAAAQRAVELLAVDDAADVERFELGQLIAAVRTAGERVAQACAARRERRRDNETD